MPAHHHDTSLDAAARVAQFHPQDTLESIINSLAEGVIIADSAGKFIFFNQAAKDILGIGSMDVTAPQWTAIYGCFYPDEKTPYPGEHLPLARAMQGQVIHDELIFIRNDAKPQGIFISVSASPLRNSAGEVSGGTVILRDVSENKRTMVQLRQSEERLQAQFDGFPIPTYVWKKIRADFYLIDFNKAADAFTQNKVTSFVGKKLQDVYADRPQIVRDFYRCHEEGQLVQMEMSYNLYTTGEFKDLEVTFVPVPPDLVLVHTKDITDRKRAEQELRKLSNAVEQTADSVIITDARGAIIYVNPAFEKTTGYQRDEIIGKKPNVLKSGQHPKSFYDKLWKKVLSGQPFRASIINKKKDGSFYWAEQTITPMKDESGAITNFVAVTKDMTDFKERQEQEFQLRIAHEVQLHLNKKHIQVPGFDIAAVSHAMVHTSGDYFDFFTAPDGSIIITVADVAGHGIGAALIMASTRAYLRSFAQMYQDPADLLNALNKELCRDLDTERYVTLLLARIDPQTRSMEYANAGHIPSFMLDRSGELCGTLQSTGIPLGWLADYRFEKSAPISLEPESVLVFVTDGLTEARALDKKQFGFDRILKEIKKHRDQSAQKIADRLYEKVRSYSGKGMQEDDITAVVCKVMK